MFSTRVHVCMSAPAPAFIMDIRCLFSHDIWILRQRFSFAFIKANLTTSASSWTLLLELLSTSAHSTLVWTLFSLAMIPIPSL
mgnify:CR=1 FL=1